MTRSALKWSILVLTLPQRRPMLERLVSVLAPQIDARRNEVELRVRPSDPLLPVGENREILRQEATGEYISFIDDDDLVPPHFVERILPLLDGVDYVGFNLEQMRDGHFACIEKRSLAYGGVRRDENFRYRDISHLNPMRRELALRVPMTGWPAEDSRWADALRALHIVKTENRLDETLYYYLARSIKPELMDSMVLCEVGSEPHPWRLMPKVKVKMLTGIAGGPNPEYDLPEHGYMPQQIVELHPRLAEAWIESGICERVVEKKEKEPEKVADKAPEKVTSISAAKAAQAQAPAAKPAAKDPEKQAPKAGKSPADPV